MSAVATPSSSTIPPRWGWAFIWGLVGLSLFGWLTLWMLSSGNPDDYEAKRSAKRVENLAKLRQEEQTILTTTGWVDKNKGTVHIPIEEAMAQEVAVLKDKSVRAAALINPPAPVAVPAASSTTTAVPAAAAAPASSTTPATPTPTPAPAAAH